MSNGRKPRDQNAALLTAQEERELATRFQKEGDIAARNRLVTANLGLVHMLVHQIHRKHKKFRAEDLFQEGVFGIMRGAELFEPERGLRFSTYVVYWIRAKIYRFIHNEKRAPAVKGGTRDEYGRLPRQAQVSMDDFASNRGNGVDDERTIGSMLASEADSPEEDAIKEEMLRFLLVATEGNERTMLVARRRFIEGDTLSDVGDDIGLSREGVRLIENKIIHNARILRGGGSIIRRTGKQRGKKKTEEAAE